MVEWKPGARFGRYKLIEKLGRGGMAETWRGELQAGEGVRKSVVIKRILPSYSDNAEFIEAFVQEARLTASLSHGNIAQVFDFGEAGDSHFIAMEMIDGRSLDRVLKHGVARGYWHMPYPIATLIALEVAKGLEHVHTRRGPKGPLDIVHRDISPDNIIVGMNGETKLIDFGVAKSVLQGRPETEAGVVKGKYLYFSPEQAGGQPVDFRTDLYALGVVLYRLVTGKKAFEGPGLMVLQQVAAGDYVPVRVANPGVPEVLAEVIETMMAHRKEDRFATTLEMVEALSFALREMAPKAGVHWIRDWVRWLYTDDLKKRGEEPELRTGFTNLLANWKPSEPQPELEMVSSESRHNELATIASRGPQTRRRATSQVQQVAPPWTKKQKRTALIAGSGALVAVVALVVFTTTRDPHEGESDELRRLRIAEAMRMKPVEGGTEPKKQPAVAQPLPVRVPLLVPVEDPSANDDPREPVAVQPKPPPESEQYEGDAPLTFTLTEAHQVSLDNAPRLPGSTGELKGAQPRTSHGKKLPTLLYAPGRKPTFEILGSLGTWSQPNSRFALLIADVGDVPPGIFALTVGDQPVIPGGVNVVVESRDRFTVQGLAGRSWTVKVTPRAKEGDEVTPPLLVGAGLSVKLDGKPTIGGYAVLAPGTHRLSGATSAWFTVPSVSGHTAAEVEISISK